MALLHASSFDLTLATNLVGGELEGQPPRNNPCQTAGEYQSQYAGSGVLGVRLTEITYRRLRSNMCSTCLPVEPQCVGASGAAPRVGEGRGLIQRPARRRDVSDRSSRSAGRKLQAKEATRRRTRMTLSQRAGRQTDPTEAMTRNLVAGLSTT
eukprot:3117425-Pleurochrysis_carterae.AAC.1